MKQFNFLGLVVSLLLTTNVFGQYSEKSKILSDLDYLYASLQEAHYDLFAYTSQERLDSIHHLVRKSITADSLNTLEITNHFQRFVSAANNGHTEIDFPITAYTSYAYEDGTVFPLELAMEGGKALIRKNFSSEQAISLGSEVISINGLPMHQILEAIYPQISAERPYFKNAKMETYAFPRYYWQVFGQQDLFDVVVNDNGNSVHYKLEAINLIQDFEMPRDEVLNAQMNLRFFDKTAYLNPGNFSGDETVYESFIDSAFTAIRAKNCPQLIIDLRNNGGGDNSFSDYLVSYIADKPFLWASTFSVKSSDLLKEYVRENNDTTDAYFRRILDTPGGQRFEFAFDEHPPQEPDQRFAGEVYVLINRQSHSQAAVSAAQIQDYGFGTIVGEETGEFPSLYASQFQFTLPHTGIAVKVSKGRIVRVNGNTVHKGVIPDIEIHDHLLDEEDEILEGILRFIKSEKK